MKFTENQLNRTFSIINKAVRKDKLSTRQAHDLWINELSPHYKATLTFQRANKSLDGAKRDFKSFIDLLRRDYFGRNCVKSFKKNKRADFDLAAIPFFEEHASGGYHIHCFIWEPCNPNRRYDFISACKSRWKYKTGAEQIEIEPVATGDITGYSNYSSKKFGRNFLHQDRVEYFLWDRTQ